MRSFAFGSFTKSHKTGIVKKNMTEELVYPFNSRDEIQKRVLDQIEKKYGENNNWDFGLSAIRLFFNSSGHPDKQEAMGLLLNGIVRANEKIRHQKF